MMNFLTKLFPWLAPEFVNWTENIKNNNNKIRYPKTNDDIKALLVEAKEKMLNVRVVGSGHSMCPTICDSTENYLMLISLRDYNLEPRNIDIDHNKMEVTVNAGYKLATLYDQLSKYNYFLPTQPASSVFSVGGVVSMPAHGCRIGGSLISDYVVKMQIINSDGIEILKQIDNDDFDLHRICTNILGIITSVTFKIIKMDNIEAQICSYYNIFYDDRCKIKRFKLDTFFKSIIMESLSNEEVNPQYVQCFLDFHNNTLLCINWQDADEEYLPGDYPDVTNIHKVQSLEYVLTKLHKGYREDQKILNLLGKLTRHEIEHAIEKNMQEDRDMFWVTVGARTYFMSYFIPIHEEGDVINLDKLYAAIECIMIIIRKFKAEKRKFNIELPCDIRFITSTDKCLMSPIYRNDGKKTVYVSIEVICFANNLHLKMEHVSGSDLALNYDFREFYYTIEQEWIKLGGVPHWGKMFGFYAKYGDPFSYNSIKNILDTETKKLITTKAKNNSMFTNNFVNTLLF